MDLRRKRTSIISVGSTADLPEVAIVGFAENLERSGDDQLAAALASLPPQLRETVVLRYYEEKTLDEIAAILQVPPGTIKSRLHTARAALNDFLTRKEHGNETERYSAGPADPLCHGGYGHGDSCCQL